MLKTWMYLYTPSQVPSAGSLPKPPGDDPSLVGTVQVTMPLHRVSTITMASVDKQPTVPVRAGLIPSVQVVVSRRPYITPMIRITSPAGHIILRLTAFSHASDSATCSDRGREGERKRERERERERERGGGGGKKKSIK